MGLGLIEAFFYWEFAETLSYDFGRTNSVNHWPSLYKQSLP